MPMQTEDQMYARQTALPRAGQKSWALDLGSSMDQDESAILGLGHKESVP